ncbi:MAG TPA: sensor histidine kinase [Nitrospirae bacterium]|nr:sensor protein ZraS [bacterium BMS3Abin06]HDH10752.1 sensor histidine kinase [Nitrospirota bacterium]HDZ03040.1 sensor histidine kinase [Nitrospirota bacterium]
MLQEPYKKLKIHWDKIKADVEVTDIAYIVIRLIILCGGIGWLIFSDISQKTSANVGNLFIYFVAYSFFLYIWLFFFPRKKQIIYIFSLFFDLSFTTILVRITGGFYSHFFNGFYLVTALYSFKFGTVPGTAIAVISTALYLASGSFDFNKLHWTNFSVRVAFLFLLALPIGILSQKLRSDKDKIEKLNKELEITIENLRTVHRKLIRVEKLSALGRMTADVAHEIRNPLTSIGGFARRLNNKLAPDSKEKEYAEIVISEVNRLERILKDVLTFSRESKYIMEYQEINGIIKESLQTFVDICNEQKIQVEEKLDTSLPPILIDRDQVRLAVNNLISNAVGVMSGGGTLTVKTFMKNLNKTDYVVAEVADTGPGIPDEALDIIFEPFYTTKEIGAGTGLGLPICKKIIDEHNGLIFVESELGKGTSFKLFFPYQSKENGDKIKCWEFTKCGVEKAEGAMELRCPAYPNYGRICWSVAGTFCGKRVTGAIAQKLGDCRKCEFYQRVAIRRDL